MTTLQKILVGLLGLQILLVGWVFWPDNITNAEQAPLLSLNLDEINQLTITDNEGEQAVLAKQGDNWVLASGGNYPADSLKVTEIISKVLSVETGRLVTTSEESHSRLKVAGTDFINRIELNTINGNSQILYSGTAPNPSGTHVRLANDPNTYLTGEFANWELRTNADNWVDPTSYIGEIDREAVTAVTLENNNGSFTFNKEEDGSWSFDQVQEAETLIQTKPSAFINQALGLRIAQPLGTTEEPAYGLDAPQARLILTVEENNASQQYILQIGAQDGESYIVKWSEADYYITVSSFSVQDMVTNGRSDFIQTNQENPASTDG